MLNKIDVKPFDQLSDENKALLTKFQEQENVTFHHTSNVSKEGIMNMRNEACDQLLLLERRFWNHPGAGDHF